MTKKLPMGVPKKETVFENAVTEQMIRASGQGKQEDQGKQ